MQFTYFTYNITINHLAWHTVHLSSLTKYTSFVKEKVGGGLTAQKRVFEWLYTPASRNSCNEYLNVT